MLTELKMLPGAFRQCREFEKLCTDATRLVLKGIKVKTVSFYCCYSSDVSSSNGSIQYVHKVDYCVCTAQGGLMGPDGAA